MNYPVIVVLQLIHILHRATGSRGYTGKTRLGGFQALNFTEKLGLKPRRSTTAFSSSLDF
ncbi:MAG: hypothetical protein V7K67_04635 [Nostoc sp.]|uniref:hypothetical protein n=1 Tax=Nostoc sp. TaxID=1180 RepID=UPI002FFC0079